jgi:hypothetical protein
MSAVRATLVAVLLVAVSLVFLAIVIGRDSPPEIRLADIGPSTSLRVACRELGEGHKANGRIPFTYLT